MSDSKPLVSVIVRCFNREDTLGRALESIFQQGYDRLEVILIDDGSTDQSRTIAHQFEKVRYFYQENQGLAGARESGLKRSTGKYVAFLDADDFWKPNFIEDSVSALEHLGCDFVFSNWATEGPGKSHQERLQLDRVSYLTHYKANSRDGWCLLSSDETRALFMKHQPGVPSATVLRRDKLSLGWNTQAISADDWSMIIGLVIEHAAACAFHLDQRWTRWIDGKNICEGTSDMGKRARNEIHDTQFILDHFASQLSDQEIATFRRLIGASAFDLAHITSHAGKAALALKYYWIAFRTEAKWKVLRSALKVPLLWVRSALR